MKKCDVELIPAGNGCEEAYHDFIYGNSKCPTCGRQRHHLVDRAERYIIVFCSQVTIDQIDQALKEDDN